MWNERRARKALLDTFGDIRLDGTMASISGSDDPHILITKSLQQYIQQTNDLSVLMEERPYFDDFSKDETFKSRGGNEYKGTLLEHLLIINLTAFYQKPYGIELVQCLEEISSWVQRLWEEQGIRHFEIAMELDVLLAHREELFKEEGYLSQVHKQFLQAVRGELAGVKTHLPARQIMDSLDSKVSWIKKEREDEL